MKKFLHLILRYAVSAFFIILVLAAFHVAQTPFQTVVISGLVILSVSMNFYHLVGVKMSISDNKRNFSRFHRTIRKLHSSDADEDEYIKAGENTIKEDEDWIDSWSPYLMADGVIAIIAIYQLIAAVLS
jgi:hypothetical protein